MHVELIGCTSAGKTTLARRMVQAARGMRADAVLSDEFLLRRLGLHWMRNGFIRRRIVEAYGSAIYLRFRSKYRDLARFVIRASFRAPGSWIYRFHIARITLRKLGIYETIRRRSLPRQIVIADNEGVLQAAHNLFVHSSSPLDARGVSRFASLAPLPDVVLYLVQPENVLIERTLARGHRRIHDLSRETVGRFVSSAVAVFDELSLHPAIASRLLRIDGERGAVTAPQGPADPSLAEASRLVRAAMNLDGRG